MAINLSDEGYDLWRNLMAANREAATLLNTLIIEANDTGRGELSLQRLSGKLTRKPDAILADLIMLQRMELVRVEQEPLKTQKIHYRLTSKAQKMISE